MTSRPMIWWTANAILLVVVGAVVAVGVWQSHEKSRVLTPIDDQKEARQALIEAATADTMKILTYTSDTVEQDLAAAAEFTTGSFADYFEDFAQQVVIPQSQRNRISTSAKVVEAGAVSIEADKGVVLVYLRQATTSATKLEPEENFSAAEVGLRKVNGAWLIEKFDPK